MVVCIYGPGGNFNGRYPQEVNAPVKDPAACAGEDVVPVPSPPPTPPTPRPRGSGYGESIIVSLAKIVKSNLPDILPTFGNV